MRMEAIRLEIPEGCNLILAQSHFIKTVEDVYETIVSTAPGMKFGVAFNEASGPCLTRFDGNDDALQQLAVKNATAVGSGHLLVILLKDGFPINLLGRLKEVPEICTVLCATANPTEVIVVETDQGRGVFGVVDGSSPKGIETADDKIARHQFLRKIGYKR